MKATNTAIHAVLSLPAFLPCEMQSQQFSARLLHLHLFQFILGALQSEAHFILHPLCIETPLVKCFYLPELWLCSAFFIHLKKKKKPTKAALKPWWPQPTNETNKLHSWASLCGRFYRLTDTFSNSSSTAFLSRRDLSIWDALSAHSYKEEERRKQGEWE